MTDGLRIAHLRIAPQWAILRWAILTFTLMNMITMVVSRQEEFYKLLAKHNMLPPPGWAKSKLKEKKENSPNEVP